MAWIEVVGAYEVPDAPDAQLIELRVASPPELLDVGEITQEDPGRPRDDWQVPWLEEWLDTDSERRLVFFLHFVSFDRPLLTPAGPVELPAPTALPDRFAGIEYEPVD